MLCTFSVNCKCNTEMKCILKIAFAPGNGVVDHLDRAVQIFIFLLCVVKMISFGRLLVEAIVVAISFLVIFAVVHWISMLLVNEKAMTNHVYLGFQVAFAAGLFHICCEIVGVNGWYCENRH